MAAFDAVLVEPRAGPPAAGARHVRFAAWYRYACSGDTDASQRYSRAGICMTGSPASARSHPDLARVAAIAHAVYSPEVRHPVEVGADQEEHLVRLAVETARHQPEDSASRSRRVTALVGGRLLPGERGPAAQFMYQDIKGQRLTLYVRVSNEARGQTAFRFAQENGVGVFYWLDGRLGYALSGETDRGELLRVADAVYRQLNP